MSLHTDWEISTKHKLTYGYQFSTNNVLFQSEIYESSTPVTNELTKLVSDNITHALYNEYKFKLNKKTKVNLGLRANYFSIIDKLYLEPRINTEFKIKNYLKARISVEYKNQVVSQVFSSLSNFFDLDNRVWLLSNSEDNVLKSKQLTSGLLYNKNNWNIHLEAYYKKTKGNTYIESRSREIESFEYRNGESETLGIDLLVKKRIGQYRTWISYSFTNQDLIFDSLNNGEPFPNNFDITHYASWVHTYLLGNFEFSLGWNIRTGRPFTPAYPDDTAIGINGDINSKRLDTYHRMDFSTAYNFVFSKDKKWRSKVSFSLFNLYDRKNIIRKRFVLQPTNFSSTERVLKEVNTLTSRITPNISYRINF
ncbi:hypothetical protein AB832_02550 [Flavobacteriaceae bacterium (ex Bugula neritina AB1)]|nr:hypothetical protein AB832_02550 [Flavobacteriaceae bacterium (ex Bugula neritina AB1)]